MKNKKFRALNSKLIGEAIAESKSVLEVFKRIGIKPSYSAFHNLVKERGYDTSHFIGRKVGSGNRLTAEQVLVYGKKTSRYQLHRSLLEIGREEKCEGVEEIGTKGFCEVTPTWLGEDLPFEIDHKDGVKINNLESNLRFLCPNCHRQTPTWGRYASSREIRKSTKEFQDFIDTEM